MEVDESSAIQLTCPDMIEIILDMFVSDGNVEGP